MLHINSTVYENTVSKNKLTCIYYKTYHEVKPLPIGTFFLKRKFSHVHFSDKLKPLRIGSKKTLDRLSAVTYEFLSEDDSTVPSL